MRTYKMHITGFVTNAVGEIDLTRSGDNLSVVCHSGGKTSNIAQIGGFTDNKDLSSWILQNIKNARDFVDTTALEATDDVVSCLGFVLMDVKPTRQRKLIFEKELPPNHGETWTVEHESLLLRYVVNGTSLMSITKYLGRTPTAVCSHLHLKMWKKRTGAYSKNVEAFLRAVDSKIYDFDFKEKMRSKNSYS